MKFTEIFGLPDYSKFIKGFNLNSGYPFNIEDVNGNIMFDQPTEDEWVFKMYNKQNEVIFYEDSTGVVLDYRKIDLDKLSDITAKLINVSSEIRKLTEELDKIIVQ